MRAEHIIGPVEEAEEFSSPTVQNTHDAVSAELKSNVSSSHQIGLNLKGAEPSFTGINYGNKAPESARTKKSSPRKRENEQASQIPLAVQSKQIKSVLSKSPASKNKETVDLSNVKQKFKTVPRKANQIQLKRNLKHPYASSGAVVDPRTKKVS